MSSGGSEAQQPEQR